MKNKLIASIITHFLFFNSAFAQTDTHVTDSAKILSSFTETLRHLQLGKDTTLTVVHLGDSHVQAGYFSGTAMRLFQRSFGNAGRGWVAPFKLMRNGEPDDYFITSRSKNWTGSKCTQREKKLPIGTGGIAVMSATSSVNIDLSIAPKNGAGYEFDEVLLFRDNTSKPMVATGRSEFISNRTLGMPNDCGISVDTFSMYTPSDSLQLKTQPGTLGKNLFYGFVLKKNQRGILYHSVGVNGAMFVNYTDSNFVKRLALLQPDLLIISLGTNETFGRNFRSNDFRGQAKALLTIVKKEMPNAAILLTTPVECYKSTWVNRKRVYIRNKNIEIAAKTLKTLAKEEGIACWDLFNAAGGTDSCHDWYKQGLMSRDRIHFTIDGYKKQGSMLFQALMNITYSNDRSK